MQTPRVSAVTRKLGPLPVWAWTGLAVAAWFLFLRSPHTATGGAQLPYTPASGSGAQQPQSGQGGASDNANAALLAALAQNGSASDGLLTALQQPQSAESTPDPTGFLTAQTIDTGSPSSPSSPSTFSATQPANSYSGDVTVQTSVGPVSYSGYTQSPAAVDASGGYANGIVPAMIYRPGSGGSVDPILETMSAPTRISTPAYTLSDSAIPNAQRLAQVTGQAVAN